MPMQSIHAVVKYGKPLDMRSLDRGIEWRKEIAIDQKVLAGLLEGHLDQLYVCPICKSSSIHRYVTVFDYPYDKCESCGHIFCATPPHRDNVKKLYSAASESKSVQSKIYLDDELFLKRVEVIARPKVDFVCHVVDTLQQKKIGKWVDIGSGAGEIVIAAADAGWDASGIESDLEECNYAKSKGLTVINEYLAEHTVASLLKGAQVVSLFNVLEHIPAPKEFLLSIANVLGSGFLIYEVPRHPSISSLSVELFPEMACRHIYPPDHLHVFSEKSGNLLLEETGFQIVGKWYFGQDFFDLICSAGANQGLGTNSVWTEIACVAPKIQQVIDEEGLADTMLLVAYRGKK